MATSSPVNKYDPEPVFSTSDPEHKLGAAAILVLRGVEELTKLVALRSRGWQEEKLNEHFTTRRNKAAYRPGDKNNWYWYKEMRSVMGELDRAIQFIPTFGEFEFLDVGCSPGGFSAGVLEKNDRASGVGISLPPSQGGYESALERRFFGRYKLIEQDIVLYDLHKTLLEEAENPFPNDLRARFRLVILDGHALPSYALEGGTPRELKIAQATFRDSLLIAQVIISLLAVRHGGTVTIRLSHIECFPAAHLVYLLDVMSNDLSLYKPKVMHSNRGTFYAIAKGVGHGPKADMKAVYLAGLRELWQELRHGGPCGKGRYLVSTDLDFVATADAILDEYIDRLVELGRGVWSTQVDGLHDFFRKKGIQV
ncbi:hypothetical protein C8Q77DRAFT_1068440 [Trametes polyzona]|nr:hypothetical protein C8Q77DRAFT_1068440 [Trametes polyzona]